MKTVRTVIPPRLVLAESTIYAHQGSIYALDARSGMVLQNYPVQGSPSSTVVNDMLYVNVYHHPNHTVQARYCRDGALLWSFATESYPIDAPIVANGVVYVACSKNVIYALQAADGMLVWKLSLKYDPGPPTTSDPFICTAPTLVDGVLYLVHAAHSPQKSSLSAFRGQDGTLIWKTQMMAFPSSSPAIGDGVVYICTLRGWMAVQSDDGSYIWQQEETIARVRSSTVRDGLIFTSFCETTHQITPAKLEGITYCEQPFLTVRLAYDGSLLWQHSFGHGNEIGTLTAPTTPTVTQDTIYIGGNDGMLYTLNRGDGSLLWSYQTSGTSLSTPIVTKEMVYVAANNGYVYALRTYDGMLLWQTFTSTAVSLVVSDSAKGIKASIEIRPDTRIICSFLRWLSTRIRGKKSS